MLCPWTCRVRFLQICKSGHCQLAMTIQCAPTIHVTWTTWTCQNIHSRCGTMGPLDHFSTNKRSTRKEHDAGCFLAVVDILQYQHIKECDYSTNIGIQYLYVRWAFCNIWESLPFSAESGRFVASSSAAETTRYRLQLIKWLWHCSFPYLAGYCPACASLHSTQFPSL